MSPNSLFTKNEMDLIKENYEPEDASGENTDLSVECNVSNKDKIAKPIDKIFRQLSTEESYDLLMNARIESSVERLPPYPQAGDLFLLYSDKKIENWKYDNYKYVSGGCKRPHPEKNPLVYKIRRYGPQTQPPVPCELLFRKVAITLFSDPF